MTQFDVAKDEIDEFVDATWAYYVEDLRALCKIDSVEDKEHAAEGAPFGPGPRAALDEALKIAKRMGFETNDGDGYAGFADWKAEGSEASGKQLGIIGHVDVVQTGEGWTFPPFDVTEKDGCLVGRGVTDDKGPLLSSLYAAKFWKDRGVNLRHNIRFIFGTNEETGMGELDYYLEHFGEPDFLFTPDAVFPVSYGEKGLFGAYFKCDIETQKIISLNGGASPNAVPGIARAIVKGDGFDLEPEENISIMRIDAAEGAEFAGCVEVTATGIAAHAAEPEGSVNAVAVLADYLLAHGVGNSQEQHWLNVLSKLGHSTDGAALECAFEDEDFGVLTSVLGTAELKDGHAQFTIDVRYPTSVTGDELKKLFEMKAGIEGLNVEFIRAVEPFIIDPNSAPVQALLSAYRETTGRDVKPFTMGGGTYARHFKRGVSFGAGDMFIKTPEWCGGMHAADEATSIEMIKNSTAVYIRALGNLAAVDL